MALVAKKLVALAYEADIPVVDAYGNTDAVDEVATNRGAVSTPYEVSVPRKSELPDTSKMFPVVDVAEVPISTTSVVSAG